MERMTGLKRADLIGKKIDIVHTNPKINIVISSIRKGEATSKIQIIGNNISNNCIVYSRLIETGTEAPEPGFDVHQVRRDTASRR